MMLQVLRDHFVGHLTYRCTAIAPRPKMLNPVALLQVRKLFKQVTGRATLDTPHDLARRQRRWCTDQDVNMILAHHAFHDPYLEGLAGLPHQLSHTLRNFTPLHCVAVLRHPDKVVLNLKHGVATVAVLHSTSLIQSPSVSAKADRLKPVVLTL